MSDLDRFELFTYVAQTCSLSQAAKHLSLTKASLSKHIKKLETDLGVDLFIRTNQRLLNHKMNNDVTAEYIRG